MSVTILDNEDLFASDADAIVNTVNCVGVMGKGIALEFKNRFPENMRAYAAACRRGELAPGGLFVHRQPPDLAGGREFWIVNLATKDHWRDPSQLSWVASGAHNLRLWAEGYRVRSIACPALGAGNGGLSWSVVQDTIKDAFRGSDIDLRLYAPQAAPTPVRAARPGWR